MEKNIGIINYRTNQAGRYIILLVIIPAIIVLGILLFNDRRYNIIAMLVAIVSCIPFFMIFERRKSSSRMLILISILVAISAIGRFIFAALPGFKPVTAIIIITALHFGGEAGFLVGSLSAIVSNLYFGQGPWTPFQMFTWGFIGLIVGIINRNGLLVKGYSPEKLTLSYSATLVVLGACTGLMYSLFMDIWMVFNSDGTFNFPLYFANLISSAPFTLLYGISNSVFLLLLSKPIGRILERIKLKYGIMQTN